MTSKNWGSRKEKQQSSFTHLSTRPRMKRTNFQLARTFFIKGLLGTESEQNYQ